MEFFDCSPKELETIHQALEPRLAWAKTRVAQTEQMALDATRLLSCTEDRLNDYMNQGFFKRCWHKLCGKQGEMMRANQKDLIGMQKYAWQYVSLLNERDLLMATSLITVRNNLRTLAIAQEETRNEIARMADKVYQRFADLEERVRNLEITTKNLETDMRFFGWLLTIDIYDYDEKYPPHFRLLKIIRDFMALREDDYGIMEIRYLHKAIKEVGLPLKKEIRLSDFIDELIDEIEEASFSQYQKLLLLPYDYSDELIPGAFILENIPVPSLTSLYQISDKYAGSSETIDILTEQLNISKKEAMKKVMTSFIAKQGIDLEISVPLRDLAVELLGCMRLARNLSASDIADNDWQIREDEKAAPQSASADADNSEEKRKYHLRSDPLRVSRKEAKNIFKLDNEMKPNEYIKNEYEDNGDGTITDHATGLVWQKLGLENSMTYTQAEVYVHELNRRQFAGYNNWRLPTIEELVSLLEQKKQSNNLYIDTFFGNEKWCWSSDEFRDMKHAWSVSFNNGYVYCPHKDYKNYVRCVSSGKES